MQTATQFKSLSNLLVVFSAENSDEHEKKTQMHNFRHDIGSINCANTQFFVKFQLNLKAFKIQSSA